MIELGWVTHCSGFNEQYSIVNIIIARNRMVNLQFVFKIVTIEDKKSLYK